MRSGTSFSTNSQKSFNQNHSLNQRNEAFERISNNKFINPPKLKFKDATPEQIELAKLKAQKSKRQEKLRLIIAGVIMTVLLLGILMWIQA